MSKQSTEENGKPKVVEGGAVTFGANSTEADSIDAVIQDAGSIVTNMYKSGLEFVNHDAIKRYVAEVQEKFDLAPELALFAAYFCKTKPVSQYAGSGVNQLVLTLDDEMNGYDYLESLRIILTDKGVTDKTTKTLVQKKISELQTEIPVSIDTSIFPEHQRVIKARNKKIILYKYVDRINESSSKSKNILCRSYRLCNYKRRISC